VKRAEANGLDLKLALAIQLYTDNRIDHADACRLAGVSRADFNRELLERGLGIHQYPGAATHRQAG
jgi:predicted HTH domain antitoxin